MKKQFFLALALALGLASPAMAQFPPNADNISTIEQLDDSNGALVVQHAQGGLNTSDVFQESTNGRAWVKQDGGADNLSSISQSGNNEKAAVYQRGAGENTSLISQGAELLGSVTYGHSNQAYVGQGDAMTGVDPNGQTVAGVTFPTISMAGSPTSTNNYSEVSQSGSGNLAVVNQY